MAWVSSSVLCLLTSSIFSFFLKFGNRVVDEAEDLAAAGCLCNSGLLVIFILGVGANLALRQCLDVIFKLTLLCFNLDRFRSVLCLLTSIIFSFFLKLGNRLIDEAVGLFKCTHGTEKCPWAQNQL